MMTNEMNADQQVETQKRIAYDYFLEMAMNGTLVPGWKDLFLIDRIKHDDLQKRLNAVGSNMVHDEIKNLVRIMDKNGYLGGIMERESFTDRSAKIETRKENLRKFGNQEGIEGIVNYTDQWSEKANSPLDDYYKTAGWQARSIAFRKSKNWTCELCLKDHSNSKHLLHAHHRTYKLEDGTSALYRETDRELMALCSAPCHKMADIARMIREGKYEWETEETMELFQ